MRAVLALEDGTIFVGKSFGSPGERIGEIVFNTGMTGYQEVLTDPSYAGQMVTMTYPLIGNYGINSIDFEARRPYVLGFIVREWTKAPSNFRCEKTIDQYLKENDVIGIYGIDTRALTKALRSRGTMNGIISTDPDFDFEKKKELIKSYRITNPVKDVTCSRPEKVPGEGFKVSLLDFGVRGSILRSLSDRGCDVTVLPAQTSADEIMATKPDGIILSNGPGDPKDCTKIIDTLRDLANRGLPIFGIGLGHQLMALAMGFDTARLKHGHRGSNYPVNELGSDRAFITSQNHDYVVVNESVDERVAKISHINMNDGTVEGISYKGRPIFTVQFYPETSSTTKGTACLFDRFYDLMRQYREGK
jgi:carbamoyl-phosphate synthase small subunit